jgi:DNA mismatch repair protein MutL
VCFRADAEPGDLFDALRGRLSRVLGPRVRRERAAIDAEREGCG